MKKICYIFAFISIPLISGAQFFENANMWKAYRHEYTVGGGVTNYNGDLGGLDKKGTNWFLFDLELSMFKYAFFGSYRYNLNHRHSSSISLFYGKLTGSDLLTNDIYRRNRNLSFTNSVIELTWNYEYYIIRQSPGHLYNLKGAKGLKGVKWDFYLFLGMGAFYHNPKAFGVPLRYVGTEGQGLPGQRPYYSPVAMAFPVGFGGSYKILKKFKIGTEFSYRFTTTDYIDDVSRDYYGKEELTQKKGAMAGNLSDPSIGNNPGWTAKGEQRGDPKWKDGYLSILVKITYLHRKRLKGAKQKKHKHPFNTKSKIFSHF